MKVSRSKLATFHVLYYPIDMNIPRSFIADFKGSTMIECMTRNLPILVLLLVAGCASKWKVPSRVCPGKENIEQCLNALLDHSQGIGSFQCTGTFHVRSTDTKQGLIGKVWVKPPDKLYVQGAVGLNPKAITLGSNASEFWLSIKPEVSSYWWGKWSEQSNLDSLLVNPQILLEAFGAIHIDTNEAWLMRHEGAFDLLEKKDVEGRVQKRIYIYCCDYQISKIEYLDENETPTLVTELYKYERLKDSSYLPQLIRITKHPGEAHDELVLEFELNSARPRELKDVIFRRRPRGSLKHEFRVINGRFIELEKE
jgi:hypothetical protein